MAHRRRDDGVENVVVGLDIGGTNTRAVMTSTDTGKELGRRVIPSQGNNYPAALASQKRMVTELTTGYIIKAVASGAACAFKNGTIIGSANLPDAVGHDYKADLENQFGVPVLVINDTVAAGLGEFTAFQRPLVYVIWGTGIGVAIIMIIDGKVYTRATELGHMIIDRNSKLQCGCGGYGHWEAHVSGKNIPLRFEGCKAEYLSDAQWDEVLCDMACGLRNLSDGDIEYPIVLGGGIANKQQHRLPQLQGMVNQLDSTCPPPKLLLARGGEDSGLIGAAYAAQQLALAA